MRFSNWTNGSVKQSALFAPPTRKNASRIRRQIRGTLGQSIATRQETREIGSQINVSSEYLSELRKGLRNGRSSLNTFCRKVATLSRSGRHGGELPDQYVVGHGSSAGNQRRWREPMPSAERRSCITCAEAVKMLKNSDLKKFSGEKRDENAKEFLESLNKCGHFIARTLNEHWPCPSGVIY